MGTARAKYLGGNLRCRARSQSSDLYVAPGILKEQSASLDDLAKEIGSWKLHNAALFRSLVGNLPGNIQWARRATLRF